MATIADIPVTSEAWVDLSTISGITVGTKYEIQNKSGAWCMLVEADEEPDSDYTSGKYIASFPSSQSSATIPTDSTYIWAKTKSNGVLTGCTLNCQEA